MKKLRIYLDTNIIFGYFKAILGGRKIPFMLTFIENNLDKIEPITSFFTMAEVAKSLKEETTLTTEEIKRLLRIFRKTSKIKIFEKVIITGEVINLSLRGVSIPDSIQLSIAKNLTATFITQDKELLYKSSKIYKNILSFKQLVALLS